MRLLQHPKMLNKHLTLLIFLISFTSVQLNPASKCGPDRIYPDYLYRRPLICKQATSDDLPETVQLDYEDLTFINSTVPIVKKEFFKNFPHLVNFNAINSKVEIIEDDAFKNRSMEWIDLSFNKLKRINPDLFQDGPNFLRLDMSYNRELVIPENESFLNAPQLRSLVLKGCNIENITHKTFGNLTGLIWLIMPKNNIKVLPDCVFSSLKNLEVLDLSHNKMKTVSLLAFNRIKPARLYLGGNPWECYCDLYPVIQWSKNIKGVDKKLLCAKPEAMEWKAVELNCPSKESGSARFTLHFEMPVC